MTESETKEQSINDIISYKANEVLNLIADNTSGSVEAHAVIMHCKLQIETKMELDIATDIQNKQEIERQLN